MWQDTHPVTFKTNKAPPPLYPSLQQVADLSNNQIKDLSALTDSAPSLTSLIADNNPLEEVGANIQHSTTHSLKSDPTCPQITLPNRPLHSCYIHLCMSGT